MFKRVVALIAALSVVLSLGGCFGGNSSSGVTKTFNIVGTVTEGGTGIAISGATVSVSPINTPDKYTDENGSYDFTGLTTTERYVTTTASKYAYKESSATVNVSNGSTIIQNFSLVPVQVQGWVDYGYSELYGQSVSHSSLSRRAWAEPDMMKEPDSVIVELTGDVRAAGVSTLIRDVNAREYEISELINRVIVKVPKGESLSHFMEKLRESPMVKSVEPNSLVYAAAIPNDPYYAWYQQPWLQAMNLPAAWDISTGSQSIVIAVVDTGLRYGHEDFDNFTIIDGHDFVGDDPYPFDDCIEPYDPIIASHGTHVAGTIGAYTNNRTGVAGVDWAVRLMPVRVLGAKGYGSISNVADGITWAVNNGAHIINLSLGTFEYSSTLHTAVRNAYNSGVILVAASGNDGINTLYYPAAYDEVIAVGAAGNWINPLEVASFSNGGPGLDLIAPGVGVWSTNYNSVTKGLDYQPADGTSMACPHVAGVIGLMLAHNLSLRPDEVKTILRDTAVRQLNGEVWGLRQGYGFINAYAAITQATFDKARLILVDDQLNPISNVVTPEPDRKFSMSNIPAASKLYVFGWLDVDGSGTLDVTDYSGYKQISTLGSGVADGSFRMNIHSTFSAGDQAFIARGLAAMGVY